MFYSQFILAKKGPLGTIWIAAHLERKLRKNQVADTDIGVSVDSILFPEVPIALRLSSHLLLGVVRIYSRKVNYLFDDCSEALLKIKQAFRSTAVDLPPEESTAPYHSITLPETFDLDDFELPDNDIFQGNYVDHHISTREQITLQDTMDGVVYSTSQFGLDERFGDGDASQIGLDLDEELLLNKETAGHGGVSDADPQGSVKPMTPWDQDDTNEQINDTSEAMAVNDGANQLERLSMNAGFAEYAEAPSTPGLVEQPNLSNAQEALVSDDHLDLEDRNSNDLVAAESTKAASSKSYLQHEGNVTIDSNHDTVQCKHPEENGYHGDLIKPTPLVSEFSEGTLDAAEVSERMGSIHNVSMPSVKSCKPKLDETTTSPSSSQVTSDAEDPNRKTDRGSTNVPVSEGYFVDDQASIKTKFYTNTQIVDNEGESGSGAPVDDEGLACKEHEGTECLGNKIVHKEMASFDTNWLKPCSSHLGQPDVSSSGHENSVTPNIQSEGVEPCSFETTKRNVASIEVQGEECQVTDIMQSEENQISGPACGEIHADSSILDRPLDNAISGDNQLQNLNSSSELPAPEMLLSVPDGFHDKPNDLLVESTPAQEVLAESGVGTGNKPTSGKKRSYTESTLTMESLNSSESFGVTRAKRTSESIPDDDDLLSSILVGRRSSVLKMKPTPPAPEVASRKRTRSAPQTSALKRKVLIDDTMVLHGDIIRQQLTSTEDIRRIRKKAPCTCPEILMIRIQFLEDEIFSEPTLTGMSAELMSLHCESHDLSKVRVSENDAEVQKDEGSARPCEGGMEGNSEAVVLRNDVEAHPADTTIRTESEQGGDHQLGSHDLDTQGRNAIIDMDDLKTMQSEPLAEITDMHIDRGNTNGADAANCSTAHGMPGHEKTDAADVSLQIDASCLAPEQKVDAPSVEEDASILDVGNSKGIDGTQTADQNADEIVAFETETKDRDELPSEEGKVGVSVENGADAFTENVNTLETASLENDGCNNLASANNDPSKLGVVNEDGTLVADFGCDGKGTVPNHLTGEEPIMDLVENVADLKNAGLETGENSIFREVDLQSAMDVEIDAFDHRAVEDHGELEGFGMGNDTEFLNVDDDEAAEDDFDDGMERTEDARLLENSGWSSRTRAVAKYLQTLFDRETTNGRKVLAMDNLLTGKTRKEASRMFFETLVLKSKDYIHVEQARPLDNINIKPRSKLMKSEF